MKAHYCLPKFVTLSPFLKMAFHHDTNEQSRKASGSISSVCLLCSLQTSHHEGYSCRMPQCVSVRAFWHFFFITVLLKISIGWMFLNSLLHWSSTLCEGSFLFQIWSSVFLDFSWLLSILPIVVFPWVSSSATSPCSHASDVLFQIHETAQQCSCL